MPCVLASPPYSLSDMFVIHCSVQPDLFSIDLRRMRSGSSTAGKKAYQSRHMLTNVPDGSPSHNPSQPQQLFFVRLAPFLLPALFPQPSRNISPSKKSFNNTGKQKKSFNCYLVDSMMNLSVAPILRSSDGDYLVQANGTV